MLALNYSRFVVFFFFFCIFMLACKQTCMHTYGQNAFLSIYLPIYFSLFLSLSLLIYLHTCTDRGIHYLCIHTFIHIVVFGSEN